MQPEVIRLPKFLDPRGSLSYFEEENHFPFKIKRVYWIYDVPGGEIRGGHAFRQAEELIIALSGSFDLVTHDGNAEHSVTLNRSYYGVLVPRMTWRTLRDFSTNSLALIVSSTKYSPEDYIRDFNEFLNLKAE